MKKCFVDECQNNVFGTDRKTRKKYCKKHQYMRTDLKRNLKRFRDVFTGGGVAHGNGGKNENTGLKTALITSFGYCNQKDMFLALWNKYKSQDGKVRCFMTGDIISITPLTPLWYSCFAHILRKGKYTYFKLNPDNIRILHPDVHYIVDNWTSECTAKYPWIDINKWLSLQEEMKVEYYEFLKHNNT